jgi:hypothetical protein
MIWSFTRIFVPSGSGRQRYSFLGAVESRVHDFVSISTAGSINAEVVYELLEKISATYLAEQITLVMDSARYQRSRSVMEMADALDMERFTFQPILPTLISLNVFGVSSKPGACGTNTSQTLRCLPAHSMSSLTR